MEADVSVPRMQILITRKHGDASRSKLLNAPTRRVDPPRHLFDNKLPVRGSNASRRVNTKLKRGSL